MTALRVGFPGDSYRKRSFTRRYQHFFRNPKLAGGLLSLSRLRLNASLFLLIAFSVTNGSKTSEICRCKELLLSSIRKACMLRYCVLSRSLASAGHVFTPFFQNTSFYLFDRRRPSLFLKKNPARNVGRLWNLAGIFLKHWRIVQT